MTSRKPHLSCLQSSNKELIFSSGALLCPRFKICFSYSKSYCLAAEVGLFTCFGWVLMWEGGIVTVGRQLQGSSKKDFITSTLTWHGAHQNDTVHSNVVCLLSKFDHTLPARQNRL